MTILAEPRGWPTTMAIVAGAAMMTTTDATSAPSLQMEHLHEDVVVPPVPQAIWPGQTGIAALSCQTSNAQRENGLDTWPNTVTCWPRQSVLSAT